MSGDVKGFLEELKEYSNGGVNGLYPPEETVKEFVDYIEQLQQQNEELKDTILTYQLHTEVAPNSHESINGNELICNLFTENKSLKEELEKTHKIYLHTSKYASQMEDKYIEANYIVTEFEKWLEEKIKVVGEKYKDSEFAYGYLRALELSLYELQELKVNKNEIKKLCKKER